MMDDLPLDEKWVDFIASTREQIAAVLSGQDDRLVVLVGPDCIHDTHGAMAYATMLSKAKQEFAEDLMIVMQVDFETPRKSYSTAWKGLINDPHISGSTQINKGLIKARELLVGITKLGLPISMEYLDPIVPQFMSDIVSCAVFGPRISESQVHRELASGLSSPVGFVNGTDGSLQQAVDACSASTCPHSFLSVTKQGLAAIVHTNGNPSYFVMLGGKKSGEANCAPQHITALKDKMMAAKLHPAIGVDCAHNAGEDVERQSRLISDIAASIARGSAISVVLMESYLQGGVQDIQSGRKPTGSKSVTSPCLDWSTTEEKLQELAKAVRDRRVLSEVGEPAAKRQRK
jgi:3-deoxy-7-phosphoheptulonate synthase